MNLRRWLWRAQARWFLMSRGIEPGHSDDAIAMQMLAIRMATITVTITVAFDGFNRAITRASDALLALGEKLEASR